jgi:hypothetical protein
MDIQRHNLWPLNPGATGQGDANLRLPSVGRVAHHDQTRPFGAITGLGDRALRINKRSAVGAGGRCHRSAKQDGQKYTAA